MEPRRGRGRARSNLQATGLPRNLGPVRPQVPRPNVPQQVPDQSQRDVQVQIAAEGIQNLSMVSDCVQYGRGGFRGQREIEYFRAPRPESSKATKEGISGNKIQLCANYFPITSYTNWNLYQYSVEFNPVQEKRVVQRGLVHSHASKLGPYIFDGSMLFSSKEYDNKFELVSKRNYDDQVVIITISYVNTIKTGDYANIQIFNILMKNCIRHLDLQQIGRNFYDMKAKINVEKHRLQVLPGYETTIGMFDSGLMLRSEITTKIMRRDTVYDFFVDCIKNGGGMDFFKEGIIGAIVLTTYNNQTYRIHDVDDEANVNSTFPKKDGSRMSYLQYYREKWNINIRVPSQPMLISKKKKVYGIQDKLEEQLVFLVPELCTMTGFTNKMRTNFTLMKDLAVHTQVNPSERVKRYTNFMTRLQTTPNCLDVFKTWNLALSSKLVEISGRVLPPEPIQCNRGNKIFDGGIEADWTHHLRSVPMYTCATIKQWYVLSTPKLHDSTVQQFIKSLRNVASKMNFMLSMPNVITVPADNNRSYLNEVIKVCNAFNPFLIMCIIPKQREDLYILLKKELYVNKSVPSQLVTAQNVEKNNMSINTKIAIQINAKLGGAPWRITIPTKGMMVVGFDVCHDKRKKNSYGAIVATMNDTHTSYHSNVQIHMSGEEISNHFGAIIVVAVQKYIDKNKAFPTSIVIYRDGVGDGQLSYIEKTEVKSIKTMCMQSFGKVPPLAFIIVKKRISTRFFAKLSQGMQNPPPGTIIDTKVTDPTMYDFYLVSQNSRFGTVTPTHYNIIEDTLVNWSPDKMQRLTYKLCHMYYNWSGTTRVPAPCQLAHKLASLAGQVGVPNVGLSDLLYFL